MAKEETVKGYVVNRVKIVGGEEITIHVNDEDDEQPVSATQGGFDQETYEDGRKQFEDAQAGKSDNDESDVDEKENKQQAVKAQQNKPSAVAPAKTATK